MTLPTPNPPVDHIIPADRAYELESELVADILIHFGAMPQMRIWRSNTGRAYSASAVMAARKSGSIKVLDGHRPITFGTPGTADISGIIGVAPCRGKWIGIECKIKGRPLRPEQRSWREMLENFGGIYIHAEQVSDVYLGLRDAGVPV